ncbi:MAG: SUMF1/EgtB/PvdO family nonheme iron enzyme [Candidatus Thiothrix moscowensis]|nr:SUMF1/EgtB/PvdO family nonheme iron enzyme [Candidatus Thiothrix moscowensis]
MKPGDPWFHKLESELESSDVMVLVLSEKVRKSKWVHNEFSMAEEIGIPVIPVLAEAIRLPLWLRHLQVLDFESSQDWQELVDAVGLQLRADIIGFSLRTDAVDVPDFSLDMPSNKVAKPIQKIPINLSSLYAVPPEYDIKAAQAKYLPKKRLNQPAWATASGQDQYGLYADLLVKGVTQRFRWIEPGTFWMGSPRSEPERYDNEIRHQVTLSEGFWLADTACTQVLWRTIMGSNPAYFKENENNPVEQVNLYDVQEFLQTLNGMISSLKVKLPTEAQWEYACRAGTITPFSFGDNIVPEQVNYDGNNPYVGGVKGLYRKKTVPVKSLPINPWGLYEMHGNVWEWCADEWLENLPTKSVIDPFSIEKEHTVIQGVVRGGSWSYDGRDVRSAMRLRVASKDRVSNLGFRLTVCVQV